MNLYEINQEILNCVDEETGEIIDIEMLENLQLEKDKKIENIGLWYKNLISDSQALKAEIDALTERKKRAEIRAEQLKRLLDSVLQFSKFETSKISMFYRKSKAVEVSENFVEWAKANNCDKYLTYKEPTPNKTAIKEAISNGESIEHAEIVERNNLVIK